METFGGESREEEEICLRWLKLPNRIKAMASGQRSAAQNGQNSPPT